MRRTLPARRHPSLPASVELPPPRVAGMSLIEVLIAVAIMMVIALGIIPLFTRAMRLNREGANFSDVTNVARTTLEEYLKLDFNSPQLTLAAGQTTLTTDQYWDATTRLWTAVPVGGPPAGAIWERTISVQQFAAGDLTSDGSLDSPLDGSVTKDNVQLKRIRVAVRPLWQGTNVLGRPSPAALELIKSM